MPVAAVPTYERDLFEHLENRYQDLLVRFETGYFDPEDVETLKKALGEMAR